MGGNSGWSGGQGCQQGREEEKSETRERMMRMNWEGGGGRLGLLSHTHLFNKNTRPRAPPTLFSALQGRPRWEDRPRSGLSVLRPGLWEQPRREFGDVLRPEVEQVHSIRRQQGTVPGDGGFVTAMTTDCHLNSNEQPVATATVFLVWSPSG